MKYLLVLYVLIIMGCDYPTTKIIEADRNESIVKIDGKICNIFQINRGDAVTLYYINCPDGSSVTYKYGKHPPISASTNSETNFPVTPIEAEDVPSVCSCNKK